MDMFQSVLPRNQQTRHYITKVLPCIGLCAVLLGIFKFGAGVGVLVHQGHHAAVISVPFQSASSLLIPAGICSILAGCFKIWVTRFTDAAPPLVRKRSLVFIVVLSVASVLTLIAAILAFVYIGNVGNKAEGDLRSQLQEYGLAAGTEGLDRIQSKDECCGVDYYTDWRDTPYGGRRAYKVPDSCCKNYEYGCGDHFETSSINRRGCLEVVKSSINSHLLFIGISGIVIALPIEVSLVAAVLYIRKKHLS